MLLNNVATDDLWRIMYKVRVRMYIPVQGVANVCIFLYICQQRVHHVCASGHKDACDICEWNVGVE